MNELVTQQQETGLAISTETKELIRSSSADSTLHGYQGLPKEIEAWLRSAERESPDSSGFSCNGTDKSGVVKC
ncbi:hypothetical protein C6502_15320 [Candidatus Poribacteria bacterium]|nr:MAG: hypothetical protein C6502_15320 [Candidatus Poribacteria bacterium]